MASNSSAAPFDDEKDIHAVAISSIADNDDLHLDPVREARLTRKIDIFLLPVFCVIYLFAFLDKATIGNAKTADPSILESLDLDATQFNAAVSVVVATYVIFEPVWANLLKIITPKILLPAATLFFGVITIGTAFARNYHDLIALRVLLGVVEAGIFPCITIYLITTYRREEIGRRISYIYICIAGSGALGGLISYGLIQLNSGGLVGWQYLYIVEGTLSAAMAPIAFFWIPNHVDEAWFLTKSEKADAKTRYEMNQRMYNSADKLSWKDVKSSLLDWKTWVSGVIQFTADVPSLGLSTFLPSIIKGMGFSTLNTQLLTIPVYFVAGCSLSAMGVIGDRIHMRGPFIMISFLFQIIGYIMLVTIADVQHRYAGCFILALGLLGAGGTNIAWISNNVAPYYKRTTTVGLGQLFGNSAGACIGSIFLSTYSPRYLTSYYICIGMAVLGFSATAIQFLALRHINRKRDTLIAEGAEDQPELGDQNPHFKYYL